MKAEEVREAIDSGVENVIHKLHANLDFGLKWLETWRLDIDDLGDSFPQFKELMIQRRLHVFNVSTIRRNKAKWES